MTSTSSPRFVVGALAALGLLAGCGRTVAGPVALADLEDRTLQFSLTDVDSLEGESSGGEHRFTLTFSAGFPCARLAEGVSATFNGQPMELEPGGVRETGASGGEACEPPRATIDFDPEQWEGEPTEDISLILEDDTHAVVLVVHEGKARRHFRRIGDTSGTLRRGETHTYVWVPETDALQAPIEARLIPRSDGTSISLSVQQEGNSVHLLVPKDTPEGQYLLRLSGTAAGHVLTCEGVAGCEVGLFHSEDFEVSVTP